MCIITFKVINFMLLMVGIDGSMTIINSKVCTPNDDKICISIDKMWYDKFHRPINEVPEHFNVDFLLFRRNQQGARRLTIDKISELDIDGKKRTVFIIHGWMETAYIGWVPKMCKALLRQQDLNVIAVDWSAGSMKPYITACANVVAVGLQVLTVLNALSSDKAVDVSTTYLIGHGLGSHAAGYVGNLSRVPIGRITGLDPSKVGFQYMPSVVRLDDGDASFVDIIHTDVRPVSGSGISQRFGHVDFYPNGFDVQPGCPKVGSFEGDFEALESGTTLVARTDLGSCSHRRAYEYFTESIESDCVFVGYLCRSYELLDEGICKRCFASECEVMGFRRPQDKIHSQGMLFLQTASTKPFCQFNYLVKIKLKQSRRNRNYLYGVLAFTIVEPERSNVTFIRRNEAIQLNEQYEVILRTSVDIEPVTAVSVSWEYKILFYDPGSFCLCMCDKNLYVESIEVFSLNSYPLTDTPLIYKFCPRKDGRVESGSVVVFDYTC